MGFDVFFDDGKGVVVVVQAPLHTRRLDFDWWAREAANSELDRVNEIPSKHLRLLKGKEIFGETLVKRIRMYLKRSVKRI